MHRFLLLLAFLFMLCKIHAQSGPVPEPIFSVTKIHKSLDYYSTQAALWEKEIQKDSKNADAWFYFFTATRMANAFTPSDMDRPFDMNKIADDIISNLPNTFEAHYLAFWKDNPSEEAYDHLQKAYEMAPDRYETYHDLITKAEFDRDTESIKKYSELWYHHEFYSSGISNWNYNVLMSVEPNAILITQGDNDTYPLWLLKYVKNIRQDVTVLNASILLRENYRNTIFKEKGIAPFEKTDDDFKSGKEYSNAIMKHVVENAPHPVYFGLSMTKPLRDLFDENLYLTGLAYKYSEKEFDNKAVIRNNFENKFLIDYLKFSFQEDFSKTVVHFMNQQYIPCLTVLHKHYRLSGERKKADEIEDILMKIAKESDREEEIAHFRKNQRTIILISFRKKYENYTDEELVKYIVKGSEKAFDELYKRYAQKMHAFFYRNLGKDVNQANDFIQELFIKIIEKGNLFDPSKKFSTWIYAIAGNMCKNEYRRIQRHAALGLPADLKDRFFANSSSDNDYDQSVFEEYLQKELNKMEVQHRECFLLRYQQELSIKEIAAILGCPEGTVKSRIFYTLKKLSEKLQYFKPDHLKKKDYETSGKETGRPAASEKI